MERKGYKEFFISQLRYPKTRVQLVQAFVKAYPKRTKVMIAEEKAEKEVNRYLHFLRKENLLSDKPVKGSTRNQKAYFVTSSQAKTAKETNILRTATLAGQGKAPRKSSAKKVSKTAPVKKAAAQNKKSSNLNKGLKKIKKFF